MYKNLNTTTDMEKNKTKVNKIKVNLVDLMMKFKNNPTNNAKKKIRNRNNLVEIVELILKFNQLDQKGSGLKISTPNQMLSRLPISLAQLKAGNNSEKLKIKIRQILCTDQKNLQKFFIKVWLILFKHGNNLNVVRQISLANVCISLLTNLILKLQITKILDWLI